MRLLSKAFLDERLVPELESGTVQYFDHIRRYLFAQQFVGDKRVLDIGNWILTETAGERSSYFVAILDKANER